MPTKRSILATVFVALLVTASGCAGLLGDGGQGEEIAQQANEAMQDVDTYTFDMDMTVTASETDQSISMTATGAVDRGERKLRMEADLLGQSITQYMIGDTQYINEGGTWRQQELSQENLWEQQQLSRQQNLLENSSVSFEGNTSIDGTDVYELSVDVSEEELMNVVEQQQGQSLTSQLSIDDISYTMYVTHDTHYIKKIEADMAMSAQGQSVDATLEMTIDDYGEDLSIELPAGAENAEPVA